jgi:maleamate amidohydrolase
VLYTHNEYSADGRDLGSWGWKLDRSSGDRVARNDRANVIVEKIAPQDGDFVISKKKPSAFFGTPLASYLVDLGVDQLIVAGCVTSGCVRATVFDAFSYNFRVAVVEEATFDRIPLSHEVALFEMDAKYADVVSLTEATRYLETLEEVRVS